MHAPSCLVCHRHRLRLPWFAVPSWSPSFHGGTTACVCVWNLGRHRFSLVLGAFGPVTSDLRCWIVPGAVWTRWRADHVCVSVPAPYFGEHVSGWAVRITKSGLVPGMAWTYHLYLKILCRQCDRVQVHCLARSNVGKVEVACGYVGPTCRALCGSRIYGQHEQNDAAVTGSSAPIKDSPLENFIGGPRVQVARATCSCNPAPMKALVLLTVCYFSSRRGPISRLKEQSNCRPTLESSVF
jgi:hypothetical protein